MRFRLSTLLALATALVLPAGASAQSDLFLSEYVEGTSNNKAVEIFNPTEADIALAGVRLTFHFNGNATAGTTIDLVGTVPAGGTWVVADDSASQAILDRADQVSTASFFNGNDAVVLRRGTAILDSLGQLGADPGSEWGSGLTSTANNTLRRREAPDTSPEDAFDPAAQWNGHPTDTFDGLGEHGEEPPPPPPVRSIAEIQGATHISPYNGEGVSDVEGVVTAVATNGFWFEDVTPDGDPATSEGLFAFTGSAPTVTVGDLVAVDGTVAEFRPGSSGGTVNLTITELTSPVVEEISSGNALPSSVPAPPTEVIEDDASGSVEDSGTFDPAQDGIDYYESLENMRLRLDGAEVVGPTNGFGEIPVVVSGGLRTPRGGIIIRPADFNPERIILDDRLAAAPAADVGDSFPGPLFGVLDYSFANFKLVPSAFPAVTDGGLAPEVARAPERSELVVGGYNVENLDANDPPEKFDAIAGQIVHNLRSPDLLSLQEVQDDNGPVNDGVVSASETARRLIAAIQAAGGPVYLYTDVPPVDDQDGGEPGGNIRVGFLYKEDGPLRLQEGSVQRIEPGDPAFANSRKPLYGQFRYKGRALHVIGTHFNSKGGDQPLFGRFQPPQRSSEAQRHAQAAIVRDFVAGILAEDPDARVLVLGDINDFQFSRTVEILEEAGISDLIGSLPEAERYTYVFEGNSQALDHILASPSLLAVTQYDVVHVNAEFADQISDHDPDLAYLDLEPGRRPR